MKLTYEDFLKIPYDGKRHEIIDGVHYVSDGHYTRSQRVMFRLKTMLHQRDDFFFRNFAGHTAVMGTENAGGNREFFIEIVTDFTDHFDEDACLAERDQAGVLEWWVIRPEEENDPRLSPRRRATDERGSLRSAHHAPPPGFRASYQDPLHLMCYEAPS